VRDSLGGAEHRDEQALGQVEKRDHVLAWHHQDVTLEHRTYVEEPDGVVVLMHKVCCGRARDDPAEHAVLRHHIIMAARVQPTAVSPRYRGA